MKFKYTILYVQDVKKSLEFYCTAFGLTKRMITESGDYGELDTGSTTLSFSSLELMTSIGKNPSPTNQQSPSFEIAFETKHVSRDLKRAVQAGAALVQDCEEMPWGQTTSYVRDLDGFLVEICSPVKSQG